MAAIPTRRPLRMPRLLPSSLAVLALGATVTAAPEGGKPAAPASGGTTLTAPEGVNVRIAADTPGQQVMSPTAITFDEAGNLYVAETHRFREGVEDDRDRLYWYLDDLAAQTTADRRALHEKWKEKLPLETMTAKSEVIRRLSEVDADGVFKKSNVYADGFNDVLDGTAGGVFEFNGTVYFACIPKIWALRDAGEDGKAKTRDVIQDGFGVRVSFSGHDMNGFALGPDGRIYGTIGDRGFNITTREGKKSVSPGRGAFFRFDPDGSNFEVIHTGLRNPKEIAFDANGNAVTVDNNSDQGDEARVVYLVEGGESGWEMEHQTLHSFHRQIGLAVHPPNRWMAERMWEPRNPDQPAYILPPVANLTSGPSGLTYHPGTGFLESEAGRFLICDYRGSSASSGVWSFRMSPQGAGMSLEDPQKFAWGVAATDVEYSWDGKLYIADFMGGWSSHPEGRIMALDAGSNLWRPKETASAAQLIKEGFEQRSSEELAGLLKHADLRVALRAELALTRKPDALERFRKASASSDKQERLHGVWGLGIVARRGFSPLPGPVNATPVDPATRVAAAKELVALLSHPDEETRAQAVKVLDEAPLKEADLPFAKLFADASPRVRFFTAITAGKLGATGTEKEILTLLSKNAGEDAYLFHAGSYALSLLDPPDALAALAKHPDAQVRLAAVVALRRGHAPELAAFLKDADPVVAQEAVRAIHDTGIEAARPAVAALLDQPASIHDWKPFMQRRLVHSAFRVGGAENAKRLIAVALDGKLPEEVRRESLRLISLWPEPPPADQSTGHWSPLAKRDAAEITPLLLESLPKLLQEDGQILADALGLVSRYRLKVDSLDDAAMRSIVGRTKAPGAARAQALALYAERNPADLAEFLAKQGVDADDTLALAALRLVVDRFPQQAVKPLSAAVDSKSAVRAQSAWKDLTKLQDAAIAPLIVGHLDALRAANGVSPAALELIDAAKARTEPEVKKALEAYEASVKASTDPLAPYLASLEGGDAKKGAALFESQPAAQCMRCHRSEAGGDAGGEAGPNLAGVANRGDNRFLLESLVNPGAKVASGFGMIAITLNNGGSVVGTLIEETPEHVDLDASGKRWRVKRSDIQSVTPPVSAMPPMGLLLTPVEVRDLVAWLQTRTKKDPERKAPPEPPVLDPATVK